MRINTKGNQSYREDLYERLAGKLNESTKTGAIDNACIHTQHDIKNKEDVVEYLADELPPEKLDHVCELLSTGVVKVEATVETKVHTDTD